MDVRQLQARIDRIAWYHDFDFGNGLSAKSRTADADQHRRTWRFIEHQLDAIDFHDKTILDVGCWDGYWSFYAERRGARSVLASDDCSQNWAPGEGLRLARELLSSNIEVNQNLSAYALATLGRKFDVVLCLGVYYHLLDPFYAFAQLRHCCHRHSVVVLEGDGARALPPNGILYDLSNLTRPYFLPTVGALRHMLQAAYLSVDSEAWLGGQHPDESASRLGWKWRLRMCVQALRGARRATRQLAQQVAPGDRDSSRLLLVCKPFEGTNASHHYRPPFGLDAYDDRFRTQAAA